MKSVIFIGVICVLFLIGCDNDAAQYRTREVVVPKCTSSSTKLRVNFISNCLKTPNSKSAGLQDAWGATCTQVATRLFCSSVTMVIKERKDLEWGSRWVITSTVLEKTPKKEIAE